MSEPLANRRILLTRPEGQVERMAERLRALGARVSLFPALRIEPVLPDPAAMACAEAASLVVFASANAVRGLLRCPEPFAATLLGAPEVAAIGPATATALRRAGLERVVSPPAPYDSEALLALPELREPEGRRVVIVRGRTGREKLAAELRRCGATVDYLEVYRSAPPAAALSFKALPDAHPEATCITSGAIAKNLAHCVVPQERAALFRCPLIAGNRRIADACRRLGYTALAGVSNNPGDDAMIRALTDYFSTSPRDPWRAGRG